MYFILWVQAVSLGTPKEAGLRSLATYYSYIHPSSLCLEKPSVVQPDVGP